MSSTATRPASLSADGSVRGVKKANRGSVVVVADVMPKR
jgi:hypothetical protein